jgi:V/A-type H+-transporting ATPase subunit K
MNNSDVNRRERSAARSMVKAGIGLATLLAVVFVAMVIRVVPAIAAPAEAHALSDQALMWGFMAAALSTGLGSLGAAYAVSHVGAAALGTIGERPETAGRALIFVGLAEGIAIYGLIISIMILGRLG